MFSPTPRPPASLAVVVAATLTIASGITTAAPHGKNHTSRGRWDMFLPEAEFTFHLSANASLRGGPYGDYSRFDHTPAPELLPKHTESRVISNRNQFFTIDRKNNRMRVDTVNEEGSYLFDTLFVLPLPCTAGEPCKTEKFNVTLAKPAGHGGQFSGDGPFCAINNKIYTAQLTPSWKATFRDEISIPQSTFDILQWSPGTSLLSGSRYFSPLDPLGNPFQTAVTVTEPYEPAWVGNGIDAAGISSPSVDGWQVGRWQTSGWQAMGYDFESQWTALKTGPLRGLPTRFSIRDHEEKHSAGENLGINATLAPLEPQYRKLFPLGNMFPDGMAAVHPCQYR